MTLLLRSHPRRSRPRARTWDCDELDGIREAEAREGRAQRDSDAREKAERDRGDKGDKSAPAAKAKGGFKSAVGRFVGRVARVGAAVVTGGLSEMAIGLGKALGVGKAFSGRVGARGTAGTTNSGTQSPGRTGAEFSKDRDRGKGDWIPALPNPVALPLVTPPVAAMPVQPQIYTQPQTYSIPKPEPRIQQIQRAPRPWQDQGAPESWMDQQMVPGVKNLYLVMGAGGLVVLLVALGGKGK